MVNLPDFYLLCGAIGFLWIIGTAVFGFAGNSSDSGSDAGNAGGTDAGSGVTDAGGAGADAGGVGADAGSAGADAGGGGNIDAGSAGGDADFTNLDTKLVGTFKSGLAIQQPRTSKVLLLLELTSPSTITTFSFFFGVCGYLILHCLPALGLISLAPSIVFGILGYKMTSSMTSWIIKKMHASNSYSHEEVIGRVAEVTVPIAPGKFGEVTYTAGGVRDTAPAKGLASETMFSTGSRVVLADVRNGVFYVEACAPQSEWNTVIDTRDKLPKK